MQGDLIIIAVGLVVALGFSTLIKAFTDNVVTPLINAAGGSSGVNGLGWTINGQRIDLGAFLAAIIYFLIFMAVIYFILVVPYRAYMKRRGTSVFGEPGPDEGMSELPFRRPAAGRIEVQVLWQRGSRHDVTSLLRRSPAPTAAMDAPPS